PTTNISTLSLHDALPISRGEYGRRGARVLRGTGRGDAGPGDDSARAQDGLRALRGGGAPAGPSGSQVGRADPPDGPGHAALLPRSEEHTSELQSRFDLVC